MNVKLWTGKPMTDENRRTALASIIAASDILDRADPRDIAPSVRDELFALLGEARRNLETERELFGGDPE